MNIHILNDIYAWVAETCEGDRLFYCEGQFAATDERGDICDGNDPKDWEEIDLNLVSNRIAEYLKTKDYDKFYLYVCRDNDYVCIEDPKDIDSDSIDLFDEYDSGLFVGID